MEKAKLDLTLRADEIGDVARPLTEEEVRAIMPLAHLLATRPLTRLSFVGLVVTALRAGRKPERGRAASRNVGPLIEALVALLAPGDMRELASRRRIHAALRSLEPVSLDALEDLLSAFSIARDLVEIERMYRAGLLREDWALVLPTSAERPETQVVIRALIRRGEVEA